MVVPDFCSSEINVVGPLWLGGEFNTGTQKSRKMLKADKWPKEGTEITGEEL